MTDVYKRLARKLDDLPNGFPETESGIELKILRKIFTPEEAEMALKIRPIPETVEAIAERLEKPVAEMQAVLDDMVEKGQIGSFKWLGQQVYMFFPFVVGIYEFQLKRMDRELAMMVEEYGPTLAGALGGHAPAATRVVPISTEIKGDLTVHPYEDVRRLIDEARSFQLAECICRKERELEGHPCTHTKEICLSLSVEEGAFDRYPLGRIISREEAHDAIRRAEEEGLVHCSYNVADGQVFICNCCTCCCGILRGVKEHKMPYVLAKSNFVAAIDPDTCAACGDCAEERCPMDAIEEDGGVYRVLPGRCIGCGVCAPICPTESIHLVRRPEEEQDTPPANLMEWYVQRAASRGIDLKLD